MSLPRVVVVTGTDTGVGKTVVTAALAACLGSRAQVAVFKPAQTGLGTGEPGDLDQVRRLTGASSLHEGVRLRDPLAPTSAARREGVVPPTVAEHAETVLRLAGSHDVTLVEGAGGLLVGLDGDGRGLADLAADLDVPFGFVVVTRQGLGTLNHTRLTVEALRTRHLPVVGLVVGAAAAEPDLAAAENLRDLPVVTGAPLVGQVPAGVGDLARVEFTARAPGWFGQPFVGARGGRSRRAAPGLVVPPRVPVPALLTDRRGRTDGVGGCC